MCGYENVFAALLIIFFICAIILSTYVVNKANGGDRMARPSRCRRVCEEPVYDSFAPCGRAQTETVTLTVDEYEVIRLVDYEKKTHGQCASQMDISRTTVTEMYERARYKIADCLINGKLLRISGGNYQVCRGRAAGERGCGRRCRWMQPKFPDGETETAKREKGAHTMRIAVTYEDGNVYQHFGHTSQMKLYDAEDNKVVHEEVVDTAGNGHGALAGFLAGLKVDMLICGGIGGGARTALAEAGIELYPGVSGNADAAVEAFLAGNLDYDPDTLCSHHGHEHHGEGGHCGDHEHHGEGGSCGGHGHHGGESHCGNHGCH